MLNFGLGLCEETVNGLNFSLQGDPKGRFSAPGFTASKDRALLNAPLKPSLIVALGLNLCGLCASPLKSSDGDGKYGDESAEVGDLANVRGGEEERRTTVDMMARAYCGHWWTWRVANAMSRGIYRRSKHRHR